MRNRRLWFAAGLVFLLAAVSCTRYDGDDGSGLSPQGDPVEVGFSVKIGSLAAGDDATYSLFQSGEQPFSRTIPDHIVDGTDALIKNLWVIQFEDGITGDASSKKMVGVPRFISSADLDGQNGTVQLIGTAESCYIIWVANHPLGEDFRWNLPLNATFADVAAKMMRITAESDAWPEIGGALTIMMNAITNTPVQPGTELTPEFHRNYARVTLKLKIDDAATDYRVTSVRLRNVPTSITLSELALGPDYAGIVPSTATIYPYGSPLMDYTAVVPAAGNLDDAGESETFTWYVPRNQQGTSSSPSYSDKNYYAPINATYFEVIAQRKSDSETAVFRVYPGANQINDYTLLPNHAYTSSLNVKGIGSSSSPDSRVENFDDVGYTDAEAANCYILNPAPAGGRTRKYSIPITNAIRFWSGTLAGYGNLPENVIQAGEPWEVTLLWSDDHASTSRINIDNTGTGPDGRFSLHVPAGLPACNFTVKLTRPGSNTVLWSWHFWVTDYNPDAFNFAMIDRTTVNPGGVPNGTFTYPVPNGQVERYAGAIWTTGVYANRVMMDRSLGAVENYFTVQPTISTSITSMTRGHLHYQFGRKDPFPSVTAGAGGVAQLSYGTIKYRISSEEDNATAVSMAQSVLNPSHFYNRIGNSNTWCSDALGYITTPATIVYAWHDPKSLTNGVTAGQDYIKSLYDPCPPGWKVPTRGTWDDFSIPNGNAQNVSRDIGWEGGRGVSDVNALRYWPGNADSPVGGRIYYAASGYRDARSGGLSGSGTSGYSWAAITSSNSSGYLMNFGGGTLNPGSGNHRATANPVRCVSEER